MNLPMIHVLGDVVMRSGTGLGPRKIRDWELIYFPEGSHSVYRLEDRTYTLDEPCFIITRPGELHQYEYDLNQPTRHLFIHFSFPADSKARSLGEENPLYILQRGSSCHIPFHGDMLLAMMKQILYISYALPDRTQQRGGALLLALLEEINGHLVDHPIEENNEQLPPQILRALNYIDSHLEEPLSVEQLARKVGWTHEHFTRSFARYIGRTPRETIIHRRIDRACQLLLHENHSIKQVAFAVGFNDENYFSRVFKSVKGMTASKYRKKYYNPRYTELSPVIDPDSMYPQNRIFVPSRTN